MAISEKRKIGNYGENLACEFLKNKGLKIQTRNYLEKWGEIDIVAIKKKGFFSNKIDKLHFIEVKTVSCETKQGSDQEIIDGYLLDDNIHFRKTQRLKRVFQTYLMKENVSPETLWQFDIIIVFINLKDTPLRRTCNSIKDKDYYIKYVGDVII
ncbi:YraN family protein [Patescibacteria group bacterium]|nr:YraN family protein [Patescibacteria group bacterium]